MVKGGAADIVMGESTAIISENDPSFFRKYASKKYGDLSQE